MAAAALQALAGPGLPVDAIARRSLLTPGCGTGRLSERRERLVAATLDAAAGGTRSAVRAAAADPRRAASRRRARLD